jgi:hypothetical protein
MQISFLQVGAQVNVVKRFLPAHYSLLIHQIVTEHKDKCSLIFTESSFLKLLSAEMWCSLPNPALSLTGQDGAQSAL